MDSVFNDNLFYTIIWTSLLKRYSRMFLAEKLQERNKKFYRDGNALSFFSTLQASQVLPYFDIDSLKHTPT